MCCCQIKQMQYCFTCPLEIIFRKAAVKQLLMVEAVNSYVPIKYYKPYSFFLTVWLLKWPNVSSLCQKMLTHQSFLGQLRSLLNKSQTAPITSTVHFLSIVWPWCECWRQQTSPRGVKCYWLYITQRTNWIIEGLHELSEDAWK